MLTANVINAQKSANYLKKEMVNCVYRHFKGEEYVVTDVAVNFKTLEPEVIYKDFATLQFTWCRPLSDFMSGVDATKCPDTLQDEKFKKIGRCGVIEQ